MNALTLASRTVYDLGNLGIVNTMLNASDNLRFAFFDLLRTNKLCAMAESIGMIEVIVAQLGEENSMQL
jgi:hypothetical protein